MVDYNENGPSPNVFFRMSVCPAKSAETAHKSVIQNVLVNVAPNNRALSFLCHSILQPHLTLKSCKNDVTTKHCTGNTNGTYTHSRLHCDHNSGKIHCLAV